MGKKVSEAVAVPKGWPEPPFMMVDTASIAGTKLLILARSALAWIGVEFSPYDTVRDIVVHDHHTSRAGAKGRRFHPWEHNTNLVTGEKRVYEEHVRSLRLLALRHGATPEAIRLLDGIQPFARKEVEDMAGKLSKKTEAPKAEKAPKADKAPKAEKAASGRKGNPEALAKARAARADAGPDTRKLTILKKENPYREGSNRAASFDALKGAKTAQEYKDAGGKAKYLSRWAEDGLIKLG